MKQILFNNSVFFDQAAVLLDGKLTEYLHEEKDNNSFIGNIYKGRVMNILPGMEACFVDIGLDKNAYLFSDELLTDKFLKQKNIKKKDISSISQVLKKGEEILVQVIRDPIGEKNVAVTTDISFTGKYIAFVPNSMDVFVSAKIKNEEERQRLKDIGRSIMNDGNGMVIRTFAYNASGESIENEYSMLSTIYGQLTKEFNYSFAPKLLYKNNSFIKRIFFDYIDSNVDEIYVEDKNTKEVINKFIYSLNNEDLNKINVIVSSDSFDQYNVDKQIDMLFERKVELENGGSIFIDVTEAMTIIDVNSGKYIGKENLEKTALSLNLLALEEIGRQIKLRDISGIIIIDFVDLKNEENINAIINKAKQVFKNDKAKISIAGVTKLNLMELTRKKDKENFYNMTTKKCEHCQGSGRIGSKLYIFLKVEGIIKKIKKNTSSQAVILNVGYILYYKITNECLDIIRKIEEKYEIKIFLLPDIKILTDEIVVYKIGKLDYITSLINEQK